MKITQNYGSGVNLWPFNQKPKENEKKSQTNKPKTFAVTTGNQTNCICCLGRKKKEQMETKKHAGIQRNSTENN